MVPPPGINIIYQLYTYINVLTFDLHRTSIMKVTACILIVLVALQLLEEIQAKAVATVALFPIFSSSLHHNGLDNRPRRQRVNALTSILF